MATQLFGLGIAAWTRTARATKADEPKWYTSERQAEASHAAPTMPLNFVHIMKTGGSSIQDLLTNMFPSFFGQFGTAGEHATTRLPIFTNCTSFAGDERANVSKKSCGCVSGCMHPLSIGHSRDWGLCAPQAIAFAFYVTPSSGSCPHSST